MPLPRASSSNPRDLDICQGQLRDIGNPEDGQHYSSCIHQQGRRNSILYIIISIEVPVAVVHREIHPLFSTAFTRVNEPTADLEFRAHPEW